MALSTDQQNAADKFMKFLLGKDIKEMSLEGHSGTGKTFITKYMIESARKAKKLLNLLTGDDDKVNIHCTATTNKAATVLAAACGEEATTVHSLLGLKVMNNFRDGTTSLQKTGNFSPVRNSLLIIDEASMENKLLLKMIRESTPDCKVLHVLDPYQLLPIFETTCPVQDSIEHKAVLQTPQRFGTNKAIPALGEQFRKCIDTLRAIPLELKEKAKHEFGAINNGAVIDGHNLQKYNDIVRTAFPKLEPHGPEIQLVNGSELRSQVIAQFSSKIFDPAEAKIVAWTNDRVNSYNNFVRRLHTNSDDLIVGEIITTNNPIIVGKSVVLSTDSTAEITNISSACAYVNAHGILGRDAELNGHIQIFIPQSQDQVKQLLASEARKARKNKDWTTFFKIKETACDLRPVFASTVHKSQGSTYQKTYVDLADIGNNNNPEEVARLLYVATTRPSNEVILYGQLPQKYGG